MPIEKEAARRAERPYAGCEELSNKLDLEDELYTILCRLDRARFLRVLSSPRGSVVRHLAFLRPERVTWYLRLEEQMVRGAQAEYSGSPRGNLDANQQLRREVELTLAAVAGVAERSEIYDALSGFRALV
jgi:hypothetical protein